MTQESQIFKRNTQGRQIPPEGFQFLANFIFPQNRCHIMMHYAFTMSAILCNNTQSLASPSMGDF